MATLADLKAGDQFLFVSEVTAIDVAGDHLSLFGPASAAAGTALIAPDGTLSGALALPAAQVPVTIVTGFAPVSVGDIMENGQTGETAVCRWSQVGPGGTVTWSSSTDHRVIYPSSGWTTVGHVNL